MIVHTLWSCPGPQHDIQHEAFFACPVWPTQAHFLVKQLKSIETRALMPWFSWSCHVVSTLWKLWGQNYWIETLHPKSILVHQIMQLFMTSFANTIVYLKTKRELARVRNFRLVKWCLIYSWMWNLRLNKWREELTRGRGKMGERDTRRRVGERKRWRC